MASSVTRYRVGVWTPGMPTLWHDVPSLEAATFAWQLLRDYGREEVSAVVQRREDDGLWTTVLGLRTT
jgi:hypothetical protein